VNWYDTHKHSLISHAFAGNDIMSHRHKLNNESWLVSQCLCSEQHKQQCCGVCADCDLSISQSVISACIRCIAWSQHQTVSWRHRQPGIVVVIIIIIILTMLLLLVTACGLVVTTSSQLSTPMNKGKRYHSNVTLLKRVAKHLHNRFVHSNILKFRIIIIMIIID